MTETCELSTRPTPARQRPSAALPVLISIPKIAVDSRSPRLRVRRRRLRREVRAVGYALLIFFPLSMAWFTFGGGKRPAEASSLVVDRPVNSAGVSTSTAPMISLAPLEPVVTVQRDVDAPVFLPGYLLPADPAEESSDGGH
jgi:hypothetical protein